MENKEKLLLKVIDSGEVKNIELWELIQKNKGLVSLAIQKNLFDDKTLKEILEKQSYYWDYRKPIVLELLKLEKYSMIEILDILLIAESLNFKEEDLTLSIKEYFTYFFKNKSATQIVKLYNKEVWKKHSRYWKSKKVRGFLVNQLIDKNKDKSALQVFNWCKKNHFWEVAWSLLEGKAEELQTEDLILLSYNYPNSCCDMDDKLLKEVKITLSKRFKESSREELLVLLKKTHVIEIQKMMLITGKFLPEDFEEFDLSNISIASMILKCFKLDFFQMIRVAKFSGNANIWKTVSKKMLPLIKGMSKKKVLDAIKGCYPSYDVWRVVLNKFKLTENEAIDTINCKFDVRTKNVILAYSDISKEGLLKVLIEKPRRDWEKEFNFNVREELSSKLDEMELKDSIDFCKKNDNEFVWKAFFSNWPKLRDKLKKLDRKSLLELEKEVGKERLASEIYETGKVTFNDGFNFVLKYGLFYEFIKPLEEKIETLSENKMVSLIRVLSPKANITKTLVRKAFSTKKISLINFLNLCKEGKIPGEIRNELEEMYIEK